MMMSPLTQLAGFFTKQIAVIFSVLAGLVVLARGISYIEENAISRDENRRLHDAFAKAKQLGEERNDFGRKINNMSDADLMRIMRESGDFEGQ